MLTLFILSRVDSGNEELRVQVSTLKYELENIKQERDLTALHHEKELRELQSRADSDFRRAQVRNSAPDNLRQDHGR